MRISLFFFMFFAVSWCSAQDLEVTNYGGPLELQRFFMENLDYPEKALEAGTEGTVILYFIVGSDGKTSGLEIFQSVSPEIDQEAIRLYQLLLWSPAARGGSYMASEHLLRIPFYTKRYKRWCKKRGYVSIPAPIDSIAPTDSIFTTKDITAKPVPEFPKGESTLQAYIAQHLKYPPAALKRNIEGEVKLYFVVEPSGKITNIKPLKYKGAGLTEELMRVLATVTWTPGTRNGVAVRTEMQFGMKFVLPAAQEVH